MHQGLCVAFRVRSNKHTKQSELERKCIYVSDVNKESFEGFMYRRLCAQVTASAEQNTRRGLWGGGKGQRSEKGK